LNAFYSLYANEEKKLQVAIFNGEIGPAAENTTTSSNEETNELMKMLYANGVHSTTNIDTSDAKAENIVEPIEHILTYEEMF
jgi:hypothetical protein